MPKIIIEMLEGRSVEEKKRLVANLTNAVVDALRVDPEIVNINIHENPKENVARGGRLFSEIYPGKFTSGK